MLSDPSCQYKTAVDRRLIPLALMIPAGLIVAVLAKALGLGHDGRLWLSAGLLGPIAAAGTIYALRLNQRQPAQAATVPEEHEPAEAPFAQRTEPALMAALEASLQAVREGGAAVKEHAALHELARHAENPRSAAEYNAAKNEQAMLYARIAALADKLRSIEASDVGTDVVRIGSVVDARALFNKGATLGQLGRSQDAVAVYDELLARFADAPEPTLREQVASALVNKGVALGQLGRSHDAVAVYDELLARFADAPEPALREQVASALVNKGVRLGQLGRSHDAVAVYDELLARFADAPEPALRELVAKALVNKGLTLGQLGRSDDEIAVYDEQLARFADAPEPAIGEVVEVVRKVRADPQRAGR